MPPRKEEPDDKDIALLKYIVAIRADHHSCSIQQIAAEMDLSKNTIKWRLDALRRMGYLDWTEAYGSIHLTTAGAKEAGIRIRKTETDA